MWAAILMLADAGQVDAVNSSYLPLLAAALAWATVCCNLIVIPFYNKGESLHKDYWVSGRINAALATIESERLIPALVQIYADAAKKQPDGRRKLLEELPELIPATAFLVSLNIAKDAKDEMDAIEDSFKALKNSASRIWWVGGIHVLLTPTCVCIFLFAAPLNPAFYLALWIALAVWTISAVIAIVKMISFRTRLQRFTDSLEIGEVS